MQDIELLAETSNWMSREVKYFAGNWDQIKTHIPLFELQKFSEKNDDVFNPYYQTVIRVPLTPLENRIPIGIVSNTYTLAQHQEVSNLCIEGIKDGGINVDCLRCELGLSTLGEWMNLRVYFPDKYDFTPSDGKTLKLRLECFNSVNGGSKLIILFGWFRFICSNGLIIGKTIGELRDRHNQHMNLNKVKTLINRGMAQVGDDKEKMLRWEKVKFSTQSLTEWIDTTVSKRWGKLSAFRVFHICLSGHDAKYADPFEPEKPSRKSMTRLAPVPGAPEKAKNLYDVCQALSWVATNRNNAEEKIQRQTEIPSLISSLA